MTTQGSNTGVLSELFTGDLRPVVIALSDSLVQPGLLLFRELVLRKLER